MRFYRLLSGFGRPRSYLGKILFVSFLGVHVPLIGLVAYIFTSSGLPAGTILPVVLVTLAATGIGTIVTLAALWALLAPMREASRAIHSYLAEKRVPALPTTLTDQAGLLMADVQECITRLDRAVDAANAARDEAVSDHKDKFALLSRMSHELRTPLNAIIGFSEMMQNEMLGPLGARPYVGYATDINATGSSLLAILQAVLDLSQVEAGRYALAVSPVDVAEIAGQTLKLGHLQADRGGVRLVARVGADLPQAVADPRAVKQIVSQLLALAVQSTPRGGEVVLSTRADGDRVELAIASTGRGFAADDLPPALAEAIRPEALAASAASGEVASSGAAALTLAVVHSLVAMQGGSVGLRNGPSGRTVTVALPRGPAGAGMRALAA